MCVGEWKWRGSKKLFPLGKLISYLNFLNPSSKLIYDTSVISCSYRTPMCVKDLASVWPLQ